MRPRAAAVCAASALAGAVAMLSLPPWGIWPAAPVALGLWLRYGDQAQHDAAFRHRFAAALAFWLGAYALGLWWITELTVWGWAIAVPVQAVIMAVPLAMIGATPGARVVSVPAALAFGEAMRWLFPFSGVALSSIPLGAVNAPYAGLGRVVGPLGLAAAVGLASVAMEQLLRPGRSLAYVIVPSLAVAAALAVTVVPDGSSERTARVAVVQVGGPLGTRAATGARDLGADHLAAAAAWDGEAELMVWSESSAAADAPLEDSPQMASVASLAADLDLIVVANFYERVPPERPSAVGSSADSGGDGAGRAPDGYFRNATVVVSPRDGPVDRYDKQHLVPFGEYVPLRSVVGRFGDTSLVPRDGLAGDKPAVVRSGLGLIAVPSSYEIFFPDLVAEGVRQGGQLLVNPTLSSTYTSSNVAAQTLAAARLRAIETGRWVVQASATGFSAVIDERGQVVESTALTEAAVLVAPVQLRSGYTPAIFVGTRSVAAAALLTLGITRWATRRSAASRARRRRLGVWSSAAHFGGARSVAKLRPSPRR